MKTTTKSQPLRLCVKTGIRAGQGKLTSTTKQSDATLAVIAG